MSVAVADPIESMRPLRDRRGITRWVPVEVPAAATCSSCGEPKPSEDAMCASCDLPWAVRDAAQRSWMCDWWKP